MALAGCGAPDRVQVKRAVDRLAKGEVIDEMNRAQNPPSPAPSFTPNTLATPTPGADTPFGSVPPGTRRPLKLLPEDQTPCLGRQADLSDGASDEIAAQALKALWACLHEERSELLTLTRAQSSFMDYTVEGEPLSRRSVAEIQSYLDANDRSALQLLGSGDAQFSRIRVRYSNDDLKELQALLGRKNEAMHALAERIYSVIERRPKLFKRFAEHSRIRAILALKQKSADLEGLESAKALRDALIAAGYPANGQPNDRQIAVYPLIVVQPWALKELLPSEADQILTELDPTRDQPLRALVTAGLPRLVAPKDFIDKTLGAYTQFRDLDNPKPPAHAAAHAEAVRVAFIDSGIDYVKYSELGTFLGAGAPQGLASRDFSDLDEIPWAPDFQSLSHGSRTQATLLTLIAQLEPKLLEERKVELAMWKIFSLRSFLAGPPFDNTALTDPRNPIAFSEAVADRVKSVNAGALAPKIVSASVGGRAAVALLALQSLDAVRRAPWLWIMSAGNTGSDVAARQDNCLSDIPAADRDDAKILCVGAIKRIEQDDRIAAYSNFGSRVEIYAYESYDERCPNGTSCSTPAITAAAAILAAKFPKLKPEQLKSALLKASVERELPVDGLIPRNDDGSPQPRPKRKVRFFDPVTMMPKAIAAARAQL